MAAINNIFSNPELDEGDIQISLNSNKLPLSHSLAKTGRCIVCYCLSGEAEIEVNLTKHKLVKSEIIMLFPSQIVQQKSLSPDFSVMFFSLAQHILQEVTFRFPPSFLSFLQYHFYYKVSEDLIREEQVRFSEIHKKFNDMKSFCRRELIMNLLRNYFLEMYDKIRKDDLMHATFSYDRKTELYEEFTNLVVRNYKTNREVRFYADQLCISPKYLSTITSSISGYSAKKWIDDYVVLELKVLLKSSGDSFQKIADEFHFSDLAYLSNYFKSNTGMSPSEYRNG
ncbi:MAG TPA: helix-turn-helix domain-containing protein [Prolixibacteraceae bacterium]|nr:helix-turn-helix domain-containing protein [Prolixibacteraceae bacterium]